MKLIKTLRGKISNPPPLWMMRQAGRYLPEYRSVRSKARDFLGLCYSPELAAEVTLQPIRRFDFDAAILFSDILVIADALGQEVRFVEGEGPRLAPLRAAADLATLSLDRIDSHLAPVIETVRRVRAELAPEKALIGFAGAPWTVATYMVEGGGSKDQALTRELAYRCQDGFFPGLIDLLIDATSRYLIAQADAGVDAIQIFDSWAGGLAPVQFAQWVIEPTREIVARVKRAHPEIPIIGFAKGAGVKLLDYAASSGVDAVGIDHGQDPFWVHAHLASGMAVQGALDPMALLAGGAALEAGVETLLAAFAVRPHIFNLGHGIDPKTPIAHVERLIKLVRG